MSTPSKAATRAYIAVRTRKYATAEAHNFTERPHAAVERNAFVSPNFTARRRHSVTRTETDSGVLTFRRGILTARMATSPCRSTVAVFEHRQKQAG